MSAAMPINAAASMIIFVPRLIRIAPLIPASALQGIIVADLFETVSLLAIGKKKGGEIPPLTSH